MATTTDYLTQLQADKQTLVDNLVAKGVEATSNETFTSLAPKVADISSGGAEEFWDLTPRTSGSVVQFIKAIPLLDFSGYSSMSGMFSGFKSLVSLPQLDTSKATSMGTMCYNCNKLETVAMLVADKVTIVSNIFYNCESLTNLGGLQNLGMAYQTTQAENYNNYKLDLSTCPNLTHDSLMNVINNLYDIATKGCKTQSLVLGSTNLAKLTAEEIAIATSKGWSVS